ncbi:MAG: IclR family transcriptional regulator [Neisseria sp.]|nr:IclR family transcriptional regulator [Neisseria sp.]
MLSNQRDRGSSISRVLEIIEAVALSDRPISPSDLIQNLNIPKPSLHRLLQLLETEKFVQTDIQGKVVPGIRSLKMGVAIWQNKYYKAEREAVLSDLSRKISATCGLSVPNGQTMTYTDRVQDNFPIQIYLPTGTQVPMYCTAGGKLYLSMLPSARRNTIIEHIQLVPLTKNTLTTSQELKQDIKRVEQQGYAEDNEELASGLVGIAVPVVDRNGRYAASLIVHCPTIRKSLDELRACLPDIREAADKLSTMLQSEEPSRH